MPNTTSSTSANLDSATIWAADTISTLTKAATNMRLNSKMNMGLT